MKKEYLFTHKEWRKMCDDQPSWFLQKCIENPVDSYQPVHIAIMKSTIISREKGKKFEPQRH